MHNSQKVTFQYRNWRGEVSRRRVWPVRMYWGSTKWHPDPQWLLEAWDCDKGEYRDFAMKDVSEWSSEEAQAG